MRKNLPITNREQKFLNNSDLVSVTDLQGNIKYVNGPFIAISGYTQEELIGQPHNIVRHPDMPPAAFADLWDTVKSGKEWRGVVKNRCKNGDHYWVDAFVVPVTKKGEVIGYQSIRSIPSREMVKGAETLYAKMNKDPSLKVPAPSLKQRFTYKVAQSICFLFALILSCINLAITDSPLALAISLSLLVMVSLWYYLNTKLIKGLQKTIQFNSELASGDFTQNIDIKSKNEIAQILTSVKVVQGRYKTILTQVSESVEETLLTADLLSATSHDVLKSMEAQSNHIDQVATGMNEMSATVDGVTQNVQNTADTANELTEIVEESDSVISAALNSMEQFSAEMVTTTELINKLSEESKEISGITDTISAIAEQTNLLALNAAIEAARAGEQGRGFAVVADEVRNLAKRTQEATQEIRNMLEQISGGIHHSATTIDNNNKAAISALEKVSLSREKFQLITEGIENVNAMSTEIATAANEQSVVTSDMAMSIESINTQAVQTKEEGAELQQNALRINHDATSLQTQLNELTLSASKRLNFNAAKQGHLALKTKVRNYLNGDTSVLNKEQACSHQHCILGRWYYKEGEQQFSKLSSFREIDSPHKKLHATIKSIIEAHDSGKIEQAEKMYQELEPLSKTIVSKLDTLLSEISKPK